MPDSPSVWCRILGRTDARPRLVAFHGGPGLDHHVILPLARALAERFEVWLPDLPGHGRSARADGKTPGLSAIEKRLALWWRDEVVGGAPRNRADDAPILVGHSLGAWLARELVRQRRITPRALVLIAPPAQVDDPGRTSIRRGLEMAVDGVSEEAARRDFLAHLRAEGVRVETGLAALDGASIRSPLAYAPLLRNLHRRLAGPLRPFDPDCPTLVVAGADDRTTPFAQAERVAEATRRARLERIAEAGHYWPLEAPRAAAERIIAFCDAVSDAEP